MPYQPSPGSSRTLSLVAASLLLATGLLTSACDSSPGTGDGPSDDDGPSDARVDVRGDDLGVPTDTPTDSGDTHRDSAPTDGTSADGSSPEDPTDLGLDGATPDGGDDGNGSRECPAYQTRCDGSCIDTHLDPDNCGACGRTCSGTQVCAGGQCQSECPQGLTKCDGRCVDTDINDQYCNSCSNACTGAQVCSNGQCTSNSIPVGSPDKCTDLGPIIDIPTTDTDARCAGNVAQTTFRWGLCSCDSVLFNNRFETDAYDSTLGPYQPGDYGGGVGTNGTVTSNNRTTIYGSLWSSAGSTSITNNNRLDVKQQLHAGNDVLFTGDTDIRGDAYVAGDINGNGQNITFHSTLYTPAASSLPPNATVNQRVDRDVQVSNVCERCRSDKQIPVGDIVDRAQTSNDNDAIGLGADALVGPTDNTRLTLPCGSYYLSSIDTSDDISIVATGRTALYIGGDVSSSGNLTIKPTPGAQLNIFIAGNLNPDNRFSLGSPAYPRATRMYIGGPQGWTTSNATTVGAFVYAIPGGIDARNRLEVYGGLYTENFTTSSETDIHFDRAVLNAGDTCPSPDDPSTGGPDTGTPDAGDLDAGPEPDTGTPPTPTCGEEGETCSADGNCCSPLVCNQGTCQAATCRYLYESCNSDDQCCSGNCANTTDGDVCFGG